MRIISPFKDYYDCHQAYDQDRETLFIRKEENLGPGLGEWFTESCRGRDTFLWRDNSLAGLVIVAGKAYPYRTYYVQGEEFFAFSPRKESDWLFTLQFTLPSECLKYPIVDIRKRECRKPHTAVTNLNLLQMGFQKVVPSWQIYQDLIMFFANLSNPEKEMAKLSDESLAIKHGFDKWSFRRRK